MSRSSAGLLNGFIGVVIFSGSLVATRLAVSGLEPLFVTSARAAIAAAAAAAALAALRQPLPRRADLGALAVVALGVVVGFPLLSAIALTMVTAARATVFFGLLPIATAAFAAARGERPRPAFWVFSIGGSAIVAGFALKSGAGHLAAGDALMLAAIVVCGLGYAEGARLSRRLGGWQVISWALVLSLPVMAPLALSTWPADVRAVAWPAWAGLGYVSLFSMLIGFIFWYRGLALGGVAAVGQIQLLQPFFALMLAAAVLGESVTPAMLAAAAAVVACVVGARRYATVGPAPAAAAR
jgi:drug/metabolite transporter (DMT)-like permease